MGAVFLKAGVTLDGLSPAGIRILAACDGMAQTLKRDLTVTCGREGHQATDPHTLGSALDLSIKDMPEATVIAFVTGLRKALGPDFTVLAEFPAKPLGVLAAFTYVNPAATAPHVHAQLVRGFGPYPRVQAV